MDTIYNPLHETLEDVCVEKTATMINQLIHERQVAAYAKRAAEYESTRGSYTVDNIIRELKL